MKTELGESSILIILMVTMVIVFLILPLSAYTFEHLLLEMLYQDIADHLELSTYYVYQELDIKSLSRQLYVVEDAMMDYVNEVLKEISHPQLMSINVNEMLVSGNLLSFTIAIEREPTLYKLLDFHKNQTIQYNFTLPMDGE